MDPVAEPDSDDFRLVRTVNDRPVGDPRALGARSSIRSGFPASQLPDSSGGGDYEAAETGHAYPAQHPDRSVSAIREIAVPELVTPRRRYGLLGGLHRSADNPAFPREQEAREELRHVVPDFMAGQELDAPVYATSDHSPAATLEDGLRNPDAEDDYGNRANRALRPALGFPYRSIPAGFSR